MRAVKLYFTILVLNLLFLTTYYIYGIMIYDCIILLNT